MSNSIDRLGPLPIDVSASERGTARRSDRRDDDTAGASSFAGIFAGAVTPAQRHPPPHESKKGGDGGDDDRTSAKGARTSHVERRLSRLAPEFRKPLERVIRRMKSEFGHDVTVVETVRDQARQDALFAQGRTAPGPVVTWTRNSRHTSGMAADLLIDGKYGNAEAYELLARIAREEGLHTLGPMDPGHVELGAGSEGARIRVLSASGERAANAHGQLAQLASIARVAEVAQVARVAEVARVARVAQPTSPVVGAGAAAAGAVTARAMGSPKGAGDVADAMQSAGETPAIGDVGSGTAVRPSATGASALARPGSLGREAASADAQGGDAGSADADREQHLDAATKSHDRAAQRLDAIASGNASALARTDGAQQPIAAAGGVDLAHRIASLLQLQATAAARPMSHVVLRLDDADGGPELIRIGIRDRAVDAMLSTRDPVAASRLEAQIGDLQQALGRHGLQSDSLRVELLGPRTIEAALLGVRAGATAEHRGGGQQPPAYHTPPRDHRGGDHGERPSRRHHDSSNRDT